MQACIASIFDLAIGNVPELKPDNWLPILFNFLNERNLYPIFIATDKLNYVEVRGYYCVSGESTRGLQHMTVYKNGKMIHDPHPEGTGVIAEEVLLFGSII